MMHLKLILIFLCSIIMISGAYAFDYDRMNTSVGAYFYGSDSYIDESITNEDFNLTICHPNITIGDKVDLVYYTYSGNITKSILDYKPQVTEIVGNCTDIHFDMSARKALYPGYVMVELIKPNSTIGFDKIFAFNGSYEITVDVEAPPKEYLFSPKKIFDQNDSSIIRSAPYLLTSMVYNDSVLGEDILDPIGSLSYIGELQGGEQIIVNGIKSLEIKVYDPCGTLNVSGYYLLNRSKFNLNETCIKIDDAEDIVLNFAGELLDGDNNLSKVPFACPLEIRNSNSIVIENLNSQEFYNGICIFNSSVNIIESNLGYNDQGAYITDNSTVKFVDFEFIANNNTDIIANGSSTVELVQVNFTNAYISSKFHDSKVTTVLNIPPLPDDDYLYPLGQYIKYDKLSPESFAQISFHYDIPLPSIVAAENISIYRYNGSWETRLNNNTNSTSTGWYGGVWEKLFTLISPSEQLIIGPNMTDFSIYSAFATTKEPVPDPVPNPTPKPKPQSGSGGGGGGSIANPIETDILPTYAEIVELNLTLPENITVMQGGIQELPFSIENVGNITAYEISISATPIRGWEMTNSSVTRLDVGSTFDGSLLISPYEKEKVGEYFLPVSVFSEGREFIKDYVRVIVEPREVLSRLKILEYPPMVRMPPNSKIDLGFLVENIGDIDFKNIVIESDGLDCLKSIDGSSSVDSGQTKQIIYSIVAGSASDCKGNLIFKEDNETIGFAPVRFIIEKSEDESEANNDYILLIILGIWSFVTLYVLRRRRIKDETK